MARELDLPPALGGWFLGSTIHHVAQVVGARYTISPATGDAAAVVNLLRVTLLLMMLMVAITALCPALKRLRDEVEPTQRAMSPRQRYLIST